MVIRTVRAVAWMLVAAAAVFALSGCNNGTIGMKLANDGVFPITELVLYPVPDEGEEPGPEAQVNRMPQDASGSTIALLPNDETRLEWLFQKKVYDVFVTFYDSRYQTFRKVQAPHPLDLTEIKRGSVVILTASMYSTYGSVIKYDIVEESANPPSWSALGLIAAAAALLLSLVLWWPCPFDC